MAYMSQEKKAQIAAQIKPILKRYGVKGTLAVDHHSTLVLNIKSGTLDFIKNYNETTSRRPGGFQNGSAAEKHICVNPYWYDDHFGDKVIKKFFKEVFNALNDGNHDRSDSQSDYFDVGWYVRLNIGKWNKPYLIEEK
jgi:hypothetical protein